MAEIDAGDRLQADQENMFRDTADGDKVYRRVSAPALQAKLQEILDAVDGLEGFVDGLEGLLTSITSVLETIRDNADEIEGFVDGLEGFASAANALLTTIRDNADQVESLLTTLNGNTDTLETLVTATNGLLTTIRDNADTVEALLTTANATLSDIEGGIPESLGQKTMAESMPVVISSDQSPASLNNQSIGQQGAAVPGFATMIGADDGTNSQRLQTRNQSPSVLTDYGLLTRPLPLELNRYRAATVGFAVAATPTDIFRIIGSNTKTVRVKKITVSGRTTSGSPIAVVVGLIKYSTANTAGTAVATTAVPHNSTMPAATAAVNHYTANPTLGTVVGRVGSKSITFQRVGLSPMGELAWDFEANPIVLNGVSQQLSINLNSISVTGSSIACEVEWEEI